MTNNKTADNLPTIRKNLVKLVQELKKKINLI